jgi:hypothetical protein
VSERHHVHDRPSDRRVRVAGVRKEQLMMRIDFQWAVSR